MTMIARPLPSRNGCLEIAHYLTWLLANNLGIASEAQSVFDRVLDVFGMSKKHVAATRTIAMQLWPALESP
jgi:hypothetical protein